MDSIRTLIKEIRKRPELYVGQKSLSLIQAYIYGWLNRDEENVSDSHLIGAFQKWIQEKYKIKSTQSWARIILFYSQDERMALNNFFELFEEFLEQEKP
jgi:hypothetical protein